VKPDLEPARRHSKQRWVDLPPSQRAAARPSLLPVLAGYDNPQLIAHGATALVFRATQTRLNRLVAIKVITADTGSVPANVERELATTVALSSQPHIVSIIDTGVTEDDRHYIVMEYCEGGSYAQILREGGPMSVDDVIEVGIKIGEALHAAHQAGIIHRDVKPSNILRSRFGPALTDFGIARAPEELSATLTREMMTPHYASPEALLHQTQSGLSDVYSLASTAWTLLVGHPPFADPANPSIDTYKFSSRVLHEPPPPIPREDVPTWLVSELTRAMSKLPSQRHASALEFAEALRRGALGLRPAAPRSAPATRPTTSQPSPGHSQARRPSHVARVLPHNRRLRTRAKRGVRSPPPPARRGRYLFITAVAIATFLAAGATLYQLTNEHRGASGSRPANVTNTEPSLLPGTESATVNPTATATGSPVAQTAAPTPTHIAQPTAPALQPIRIDYPAFADLPALILNGSAAGTGTALRLTPGGQAAGSAWAQAKIDSARSFTTAFRLSMPQLGDGMAFVIQPQGPAALGSMGGGLGYGGHPDLPAAPRIIPSLSVEFDTWDNSPDGWDPAGHQHVAVTTNGNIKNHLFWADPGFSLVGAPVGVWVEYDAASTTLAIYVSRTADRPVNPLVTATISLAAIVGTSPAYVGFTAGSGDIAGVQDVLSWHLEA
jgi:serine/threonine protein kinase